MGVKSCLTKGEMTKVNKVVDKRKPATRKDQRFATKQEAIFGKVMADKKFIAEIDKLSTKRLRITAIQDELAKRGAKTSRAKLKRMLKEGIEIPKTVKPIIEPKIPVGMADDIIGGAGNPGLPSKLDVKELKAVLADVGDYRGKVVGGQITRDPDVYRILKDGKEFTSKKMIKKIGVDGECHWNVSNLYSSKQIDDIVIGYSQKEWGDWIQHTWGLKGGRVVETTISNIENKLYFGVKLSKKQAKIFANWTKANPPGSGVVRRASGTPIKVPVKPISPVIKAPKFVEAKTLAEAQIEWNKYGHGNPMDGPYTIGWSGKKKLDTMNNINAQMDSMKKWMRGRKVGTFSFEDGDMQWNGRAAKDVGMGFNHLKLNFRKTMRKYGVGEKSVGRLKSSRFGVTGGNTAVTLRHEMGHVLWYDSQSKLRLEFIKRYKIVDPIYKRTIERNISKYSTTNIRELFAETFAMYSSPEYTAGTLNKVFGEGFEELMEKILIAGAK